MKELPGPQNLQQWMLSWKVFKVATIMMGIISLASLQLYEKMVERLVVQWPRAWGLICAAEDKARAERLEKIRRKLMQEQAAGRQVPADWSEAQPWTCCFRMLALDEEYWNEQVRHPAAAWMASGAREIPLAPAEQVALAHMPGGKEDLEVPKEEGGGSSRKRQSNKDKRAAKAKRIKTEREELERLRSQHSSGGQRAAGGKAKGKGKSKDQGGAQICYSFANGTGACGQSAPGSSCPQKRARKCQFCLSPGHRNAQCPEGA